MIRACVAGIGIAIGITAAGVIMAAVPSIGTILAIVVFVLVWLVPTRSRR